MSPLSYNCPNYSQRTKTWFDCAMILTTWSDNIPYTLHLLHSQLSESSGLHLFTQLHKSLSRTKYSLLYHHWQFNGKSFAIWKTKAEDTGNQTQYFSFSLLPLYHMTQYFALSDSPVPPNAVFNMTVSLISNEK